MTRKEMIALVNKIINCEGTEKEIDDMITLLEEITHCPDITNFIYYDEKTPEQIINAALEYKPIIL